MQIFVDNKYGKILGIFNYQNKSTKPISRTSHHKSLELDMSITLTCLYSNNKTTSFAEVNNGTIYNQVCLNSVIRIAYQADIRTASHIGNVVQKSLTRVVA